MKTAYPQIKGTCSIRLYSNIPFDNTYKNHSLISELFTYNDTAIYDAIPSRGDAKERFLNRRDNRVTPHPLYYPRYDLVGDFNFDFSNGLLASVVLELTPEQTNANYLRLTCGDDVYYYFVTGITQNNFDTYTLSLELDVLMTYQDEFLEGMKDVPVFTKRKHCHRYTNDGLYPHCADLKKGDSAFAGVKPSLISNVINNHFSGTEMKKIEGIMWLYVCLDANKLTGSGDDIQEILYTCHGKTYPLIMMALPINVTNLKYSNNDDTYLKEYFNNDLIEGIRMLIGDGSVHGAKISPYPPFLMRNAVGHSITFNTLNRTLTIKSFVSELETNKAYLMEIGANKLIYGEYPTSQATLINLLSKGFVIISEQGDTTYTYDNITPATLGFANANAPDIDSNRFLDPKLLFSPFKKYKITAQYSTEGSEFFPELVYSEIYTTNTDTYTIFTNATAYIGDNNFYTRIGSSNTNIHTFDNYKYDKIGLANSVNYLFPCGTNALDVFNNSQFQSFYTSKVGSGITSTLSILGGVATLGVGIVTGENPMLIAGGATAIAGGVAGIATTIKGYNAKMEDLKNTPDSVNISGSNFIIDESITEDTNCLPYIIVYDVSSVIKEQANDYFYNYGYEVGRECYFNTELYYDNDVSNICDNNLMGRTIFNYIELQEDITNKINANIPMIIKQKISRIFNDGITLWSFYGNGSLWGNDGVDNTNDPDKWFMKCILDNTEYSE